MKKVVLQGVTCCLWFSVAIYSTYMTPYLTSIGISATISGIIFGMHYLIQVFLRLPTGIFSDKVGRQKPFINVGMFFAACAPILMYLYTHEIMFFIGSAISGIAGTMYLAITVLYQKYFPKEKLNKAMGAINTIVDIGNMIAFVLGGYLFIKYGIKYVFIASAIVAILGFILSWFVKEVPEEKVVLNKKDFLTTFKNKELLTTSLLSILMNSVVASTAFSFTPKVAMDIGVSGVEMGIVTAIFVAGGAAGAFFLTTKAASKIPNGKIVITGFIIIICYAILVPFITDVHLLMVVQFFGGTGYAPLASIFMANAIRHLPQHQQATGMGVYQSLYSFGSAMGPVILGRFADVFSYKVGFIAMSVIAMVGLTVAIRANKKDLLS